MTIISVQPKVSKTLPKNSTTTSPIGSPYHYYDPINNSNDSNGSNNTPTKSTNTTNTTTSSINYNYIIIAGVIVLIIFLS